MIYFLIKNKMKMLCDEMESEASFLKNALKLEMQQCYAVKKDKHSF
jgi:hypothetical protein